MKLAELNPSFVGAGGEGITRNGQPVPERTGVGLNFNCPCGCGDEVFVHFSNPLDGGPSYADEKQPSWERTGETFDTLTLRPSIQRVQVGSSGQCRWHGFITDGEVQTV